MLNSKHVVTVAILKVYISNTAIPLCMDFTKWAGRPPKWSSIWSACDYFVMSFIPHEVISASVVFSCKAKLDLENILNYCNYLRKSRFKKTHDCRGDLKKQTTSLKFNTIMSNLGGKQSSNENFSNRQP